MARAGSSKRRRKLSETKDRSRAGGGPPWQTKEAQQTGHTMKPLGSFSARLRTFLSLATIAAAIYGWSSVRLPAADEKPTAEAKPDKKTQKKEEKKDEKKKLSGADLYSMHCNRCHPERYATERTASQWKTIMLHMRVRANLPANQAKAILKYLQEDSGK
jgi:hypothetical protein